MHRHPDVYRAREKEVNAWPVDNEEEASAWRDWLSEIQRKRGGFQDLTAEGLMTKAELRSRLEELELAREAAEHELRLLDDRRRKLSGLERDVGALLRDYEKICVEELADLSSVERREVYGMLGLTVEAYPDGKLEATWLLNATISKVRPRSRSASQPAKDHLASMVAPTVRLKRVFSQDQGCWSDPEVTLGREAGALGL